MIEFDEHDVIRSADQLTDLLGQPRSAQLTKALSRLDEHCRRWIERCPFIVIASADASGRMDVSPKGDPPGFVKILDDNTIAVPDRPGNRRADTFKNVLENPNVALIFLMPDRGETVRLVGTATIVTAPGLLASMAVDHKEPSLALVVHVDEVMFHCGKSMIRSKLWQPDAWPDIDGLASYAECLADQSESDETIAEMNARFATWPGGNELY